MIKKRYERLFKEAGSPSNKNYFHDAFDKTDYFVGYRYSKNTDFSGAIELSAQLVSAPIEVRLAITSKGERIVRFISWVKSWHSNPYLHFFGEGHTRITPTEEQINAVIAQWAGVDRPEGCQFGIGAPVLKYLNLSNEEFLDRAEKIKKGKIYLA